MADIFKRFSTDTDVIPNSVDVVSSTCWDDIDGILTTFHYSQTEWALSSSNYYINVYQNQAEADAGVDPHFAIAYGHYNGAGGVIGPAALYTGNLTSTRTPTKAVYSQYKNILLDPGDDKFTFNGIDSDSIWVINFNRARYKEKLDPGNWELKFSPNFAVIDDSGAGADPSISTAGRVFRIRSGSIVGGTSSVDTAVYGLAYPDLGILVFNPTTLAAKSGVGAPSQDTAAQVSRASFATTNIGKMYTAINNGASFQARTEENINSSYYFVRVGHNEFNYSNNPTFVTGSQGLIRYSLFQNDPRVYITAVGLYDDDNNLLAVAKLSRPLLKSFTREALIRVKIDF